MAVRKRPLSSMAAAKHLEKIIASMGKSQTAVAEETGIARVSLNRFLRAQSELRLTDFLLMLNYAGIDLEETLRNRNEEVGGQESGRRKNLGRDLETVFEAMPVSGKKSYLGHVVAYAELLHSKVKRDCYSRLKAQYEEIR